MYQATPASIFLSLLAEGRPQAIAWVRGNASQPQLSGSVKFYETPYGGVLIEAQVFGLPNINVQNSSNFYGMHIHENGNCERPFTGTGDHYNPGQMPHPQHAGDLPPLLGNQGYACLVFYDKRFQIPDIAGRSVVIHSMADDFRSQPSGDSGDKIGCGIIHYITE